MQGNSMREKLEHLWATSLSFRYLAPIGITAFVLVLWNSFGSSSSQDVQRKSTRGKSSSLLDQTLGSDSGLIMDNLSDAAETGSEVLKQGATLSKRVLDGVEGAVDDVLPENFPKNSEKNE